MISNVDFPLSSEWDMIVRDWSSSYGKCSMARKEEEVPLLLEAIKKSMVKNLRTTQYYEVTFSPEGHKNKIFLGSVEEVIRAIKSKGWFVTGGLAGNVVELKLHSKRPFLYFLRELKL